MRIVVSSKAEKTLVQERGKSRGLLSLNLSDKARKRPIQHVVVESWRFSLVASLQPASHCTVLYIH